MNQHGNIENRNHLRDALTAVVIVVVALAVFGCGTIFAFTVRANPIVAVAAGLGFTVFVAAIVWVAWAGAAYLAEARRGRKQVKP